MENKNNPFRQGLLLPEPPINLKLTIKEKHSKNCLQGPSDKKNPQFLVLIVLNYSCHFRRILFLNNIKQQKFS